MSGSLMAARFDDPDVFAAELRRRCGSAQTFRAVWDLVEPVHTAYLNGKPLARIVDEAVRAGLVTRASGPGAGTPAAEDETA